MSALHSSLSVDIVHVLQQHSLTEYTNFVPRCCASLLLNSILRNSYSLILFSEFWNMLLKCLGDGNSSWVLMKTFLSHQRKPNYLFAVCVHHPWCCREDHKGHSPLLSERLLGGIPWWVWTFLWHNSPCIDTFVLFSLSSVEGVDDLQINPMSTRAM